MTVPRVTSLYQHWQLNRIIISNARPFTARQSVGPVPEEICRGDGKSHQNSHFCIGQIIKSMQGSNTQDAVASRTKQVAQNNTINDLCRYLFNASKEPCLP